MATIVFDLDGTLADTSGDLLAAANHVLMDFGADARLTQKDAGTALRGGRAMLTLGMSRLGRAEEVETIDLWYPRLLEFYDQAIDAHTVLYPGAVAAVESGYVKQALVESNAARLRRIELPLALGGRDLDGLLRRRAAALCGDTTPVYGAVPLAGDPELARDGKRGWLLVAVEAERLRALALALRSGGLTPRRIVVAELAPTARVGEVADPSDDPDATASSSASLVVSYLGGRVVVSLVAGGELVEHHTVGLEGLGGDALASTLVNELRNMDSAWRRRSQGGDVRRVVFVGFAPGWADRIVPAVSMVLPEVELDFHPGKPEGDALGCLGPTLSTARLEGPWSVDLTLRLPPRPLVLAGAVGLALASVVSAGGLLAENLGTWAAGLESDLSMRDRPLEEAVALEARLADAESTREAFAEQWAAFTGTARADLPFERLVEDALAATSPGARLETLEVLPGDDGVAVRLSALAPGDTALAAQAMAAGLSHLAAHPDYSGIELLPETRVPAGDGHDGRIRFTIEGRWRSAP